MNNPLVQPDPGLFIWTILTFLVLLALLAKFAWKPLLAALEQRQQTIAQAVEDAQQGDARNSSASSQESAQVLTKARVEAEAILTRAQRRRRALPRGDAAEGDRRRGKRSCKRAEKQIQLETSRAIEQHPPRGGRSVGRDRDQAAPPQHHRRTTTSR